MKIAVFGNEYQGSHVQEVKDLLQGLRQRGLHVMVEQAFAAYLHTHEDYTFDHLRPGDLDAAMSLGGDGTLLRTAQLLHGIDVPVMGINTGHLGYLTTAGLDEAPAVIDQWLAGRCHEERRTMLCVTRNDGVAIASNHALNEVALLRQDTSSMIAMETLINGIPLTTYKGDGLVVSTPSGSTAYNLSAGGPIMDPTTACLVLTTVSSHTLNMRPLVVRDDAVITITTRSRASHFQVSIDGNAVLCPSGATVTIAKSPHTLRLVQSPEHHFAATLRHKLQWGL